MALVPGLFFFGNKIDCLLVKLRVSVSWWVAKMKMSNECVKKLVSADRLTMPDRATSLTRRGSGAPVLRLPLCVCAYVRACVCVW